MCENSKKKKNCVCVCVCGGGGGQGGCEWRSEAFVKIQKNGGGGGGGQVPLLFSCILYVPSLIKPKINFNHCIPLGSVCCFNVFWQRWADVGGRRVELTAILYSEASDLLLVSSLLINQIVYSPYSKFKIC